MFFLSFLVFFRLNKPQHPVSSVFFLSSRVQLDCKLSGIAVIFASLLYFCSLRATWVTGTSVRLCACRVCCCGASVVRCVIELNSRHPSGPPTSGSEHRRRHSAFHAPPPHPHPTHAACETDTIAATRFSKIASESSLPASPLNLFRGRFSNIAAAREHNWEKSRDGAIKENERRHADAQKK